MVANCKDLRDAVALCLQRSECVMVHRHTPKECLEDPELNRTLPQPCYVHFLRYLDCKRGQADRSKRFIGNGPKSTGKYEEDLALLKKGNFDPSIELSRLDAGSEHVFSREELAEQRENALRDLRRQQRAEDVPRKPWYSKLKWW